MRTPVICLNCGLKWVMVTSLYDGMTIELTESLQHHCPKCGSNYCEAVKEVSR